MRNSDFKVDRTHAALLQRQAELKRQLEMKNTESAYEFSSGFNYHYQGRERWRMEEELAFIELLLAMLTAPESDPPPTSAPQITH